MNTRRFTQIARQGFLVLTLSAGILAAQVEPAFLQAHRQNGDQLKHYSWKSRTEVQKDGKTKSIQLSLVRFDTRGDLQTTPISATQPDMPQRGLRGRIAKGKKEDMLETLESLKGLARSYSDLHPVDMQRLMANAALVPDGVSSTKLVRATGTNVLQTGDSMTVWADASTQHLRKVEVMSRLDKKAVRVISEFEDLPNGPTAMSRSVIQYPGEELTVIVENFEYTRATP